MKKLSKVRCLGLSHRFKFNGLWLLIASDTEGSGVSWVRDVNVDYGWIIAFDETLAFHRNYPNYSNKGAVFYLGNPKKKIRSDMRGLYFLDVIKTRAENERAIEGKVIWVDA